ncbi:MAG: FHA domain-containing protein [Bryobacteraceae bacterium]
MAKEPNLPRPSSSTRLRVHAEATPGNTLDLQFESSFRIGRADDCGVCIKVDYVSRNHVEVFYDNGQWWVKDLGSSNGVYIAGERVELAPVGQGIAIRLGIQGPLVSLEVEKLPQAAPPPPGDKTVLSHYVDRYFGKTASDEEVGEHTRFVRRAYARVYAKQKLKYGKIMATLGVAIIAAGAYALHEHQQVKQQRALAENIFYAMKSLDVDIAGLEQFVSGSNNREGMQEILKYRGRRREMEKSYDQFLATLHIYDPKMTAQEQLIMRVARIFGECELSMPHDFVAEIDNYIKKWQSSDRLAKDIRMAKERGYTAQIAQELLAQDLPPQFFYLALQESNFDPYISGPMTRKGIAKGMWQFIPETALKYGLHLGPLVDLRRPDPGDERHHYDRETKAAARYLKDLYSTDAQASGLLVMACYNWGEDYVLPLVRSMPANPQERNFWRLLSAYRNKIPQETYDYVFYIASAAVIGENPRLFGFDFDNPLAQLESK